MTDTANRQSEQSTFRVRSHDTLSYKFRHFKESLYERWLRMSARRNSSAGVRPEWKDGVVVSLTTTEPRLPFVHVTIETLLRQTLKPQKIILWISDKIPESKLPVNLRRQQERGLEICFRPDMRPFTKVIYAFREYSDRVVVSSDDDTIYPRRWLETLYASYQKQPRSVHCHRAHRMLSDGAGGLKGYFEWDWLSPRDTGPSYWLFATGVGGILYPPGALHPEVFNDAAVIKLCRTNDDLWFKAMALLQGTSCVKPVARCPEFATVHKTQGSALFRKIRVDGKLDGEVRAVFTEYGLMSVLENDPALAAGTGVRGVAC